MIIYEEDGCLGQFKIIFQFKGSVVPKAMRFGVPAGLLCLLFVIVDEWYPGAHDRVGFHKLNQVGVLWSIATAMLGILLGFRTNRAYSRFWEGTGLLHQMRGEWFDAISCCVTFSRSARKEKMEEVHMFRHTIVRLMSLCHGSALEEISMAESDDLETIDTLGLSDETLFFLRECKAVHHFNRVEVLMHLLQTCITNALDQGVLKVAPPILSRVYQTLSRGFVNFLNAKKIADTRFPFPYAQTIAILLALNMLVSPLLIAVLSKSKVWGPFFAFVAMTAMFSLNFIGVELENPFGSDDNDLPLDHFQSEMNSCLMMLLHENSDFLPSLAKTRVKANFSELAKALGNGQNGFRDSRCSGILRERAKRENVSRASCVVNFTKDGAERQATVHRQGSSASNVSSMTGSHPLGGSPPRPVPLRVSETTATYKAFAHGETPNNPYQTGPTWGGSTATVPPAFNSSGQRASLEPLEEVVEQAPAAPAPQAPSASPWEPPANKPRPPPSRPLDESQEPLSPSAVPVLDEMLLTRAVSNRAAARRRAMEATKVEACAGDRNGLGAGLLLARLRGAAPSGAVLLELPAAAPGAAPLGRGQSLVAVEAGAEATCADVIARLRAQKGIGEAMAIRLLLPDHTPLSPRALVWPRLPSSEAP